jgi:Flp pilus assembly protein TadD
MVNRFRSAPLLASAAVIAAVALGGCSTTRSTDTTGSIGRAGQTADGAWRSEADAWGARYRADPRDAQAAINYARALRVLEQRNQAAAVLEQAAIHNPNNTALLGAYGRALADIGSNAQALEVLKRAHQPDQPDWRILSVQGAVLDQMGKHEDARRYYAAALKIAPDEPSVLSNLGLSYALARDLPKAESTLRRASAGRSPDPRVRQNLALVVGLQGRFAEAETIARSDLPPDEAAANVAYLQQLLAEQGERAKASAQQAQASAQKPKPKR